MAGIKGKTIISAASGVSCMDGGTVQAVILCAGKSTRTYPLTATRPKQLLTIMNRALLEHTLEQLSSLSKAKVSEAILVVGYKKEMIIRRFGEAYKDIKLSYVWQEEQLGTGHALMQAEDRIRGRFIMLYGDDMYSAKDIDKCLSHRYCLLAKKVENPGIFGVFRTEGSRIKEIVEKPKEFVSDLANIGIWVLDRKIFDFKLEKSERGEYEATDYITELAKHEDVHYEIATDYWLPVGYPWDILKANEFFIKRLSEKSRGRSSIEGTVSKLAVIDGILTLGKGSVIKSGVVIEGTVIIGENCEIGPNCYLRNGTTIGNNCKVGQAVEIKNSVIMDNSKIPHLSYIGDSVIGEGCNLGAGTTTANLRHDNANVKTPVKGRMVDTGKRKLGAIIGDNVHTGIHTSIYPGRKIWPDMVTSPGEIVSKDIMPKDTLPHDE